MYPLQTTQQENKPMSRYQEVYKYTSFSRVENAPVIDKIEQISKQNMSNFNITLQLKRNKDTKYKYKKTHKAELGDNWYCFYSDNVEDEALFESKQIIVAIHGFPGSWRDWLPLEASVGHTFCRWVNFFVPGFDGEKETYRGSYKGYLKQIANMIRRLLVYHLRIEQPVVALGYSGGNIIWRVFESQYPSLVKAAINLAGPTIIWNPAHFYMYRIFNILDDLYHLRESPEQMEVLDTRQRLFEKFKFIAMGDYFVYENVKIWCDTPETLMIWFKKFLSPPFAKKGWSEFYELGHNQQPILRMFACGVVDPLIDTQLYSYEIYLYTYMRQIFSLNDPTLRQAVLENKYLKQIKNFNFNNIMENFAFIFDRTGHTVHLKRAIELELPIKCFLSLLDILPKDYYQTNKQINAVNENLKNMFVPKL